MESVVPRTKFEMPARPPRPVVQQKSPPRVNNSRSPKSPLFSPEDSSRRYETPPDRRLLMR